MSESNPLILMVDDDHELTKLVYQVLRADQYHVITASRAVDGMQLAWERRPDLIVADIDLSDGSGLDFCRDIRKIRRFRNIPVVILSSADTLTQKMEGFDAGAVDFIAKPFKVGELSARIRAHLRNKFWNETLGARTLKVQAHLREIEGRFLALAENSNDLIFELDANGCFVYVGPNCQRVIGQPPAQLVGASCREMLHGDDQERFVDQFQTTLREFKTSQSLFRIRRADEQWRWMESTLVAFYSTQHERRLICVARDITERKALEERLAYAARHDSLTQLHNRQYLVERLEAAIAVSGARALNAILYIDLDNFKFINDNCGHAVGDRILKEFAGRLRAIFGTKAVLSRFGGDEFVILLEAVAKEEVVALAERARQSIETLHFHGAMHTFELNASIGVALTNAAASAKEIITRADDACYVAKMKGRNRVEIYSPDSNEINRLRHDTKWSTLIKSALKKQQFELWYQPIIEVSSGEVERYEALIRLRGEDGEIIPPGEFLPAAARWGMMIQLDRYVVGLGVKDLQRCPGLNLSINLSADSLVEASLPKFIEETFSKAGVEPERVLFEITETEVIANFTLAMDVIKQLRASGFRFALDDFGVGFSSMAYLRDLPVDRLKIDGIFISSMRTVPYNRMLAKSINEIGHFLGIKTIAEFVESAEVLEVLREIGIDYAQGNYFGAAKPLEALNLASCFPKRLYSGAT